MIVLLTLMFCFFGITGDSDSGYSQKNSFVNSLVLCNDYSSSKPPPADVPGLGDLQLCTEVRTWVTLKFNQEEGYFNTRSRLPQGVKVSVQGPIY